jgi:hypothetical protein
LTWNGYVGVSLLTYNIYRNGKRIKSLAASSGNNNYAYSDRDGIDGDVYQIHYDLPEDVITSKLKSDSGPFSQSLSNLAESQLTESSLPTDNVVTVYPNPADDKISVSFGSSVNASIEMVNVQGIVVLTKTITNASNATIAVDYLEKGVYIIKAAVNNKITLVKFIKL